MTTPGKPVVGGTVLRIPAVQSPNFSMTAQTGWAIFQNGNAYFFNITAAGDITASAFEGVDFEIDDTGMFIYAGTPAAGNPPVFSITNATVDPEGNTIYAGIYAGKYGSPQVGLATTGTAGEINFPVPGPFARAAVIGAVESNGGAVLDIEGPRESATGQTDYAVLQISSYSGNGNKSAAWFAAYVDANGGDNGHIFANYAGMSLYVVNQINAVLPGSGTSPVNPAKVEGWHDMPAFATHYSHGTPTPGYKLYADQTVAFAGQVNVSSGAAGATFVTLPTAAYFPTSLKKFPVSISAGVLAMIANAQVTVDTSGGLTLSAPPTGAAFSFSLDEVRYPVDR